MRHRSITPMPFVSFIIEVGYDALYECCTAIGFEEGFWIVELSDRHTEVVRIEIYHLVCRRLLLQKFACLNDDGLTSGDVMEREGRGGARQKLNVDPLNGQIGRAHV